MEKVANSEEIEEVTISVSLSSMLELLRLITHIQCPDVTYCEDNLVMAQQAIRLSKMYASNASDILYEWTHGVEHLIKGETEGTTLSRKGNGLDKR